VVAAVVVGRSVGVVATATVVDGVGSISGAGSGACVIDDGVVAASVVEVDIVTLVVVAAKSGDADVAGSGSIA